MDSLNTILDEFQQDAAEWSLRTFGIRKVTGPLNHLKSEIDEIIADPTDVEEFADALILLQDAAWRSGHKMSEIFEAALAKNEKNKKREWPPRGQVNEQGFTEHVK